MATWTRQMIAAGVVCVAGVAMAQSFQDETFGQQDAGSAVQADSEIQQQGQSDLPRPGPAETSPVAQGTTGMSSDGGYGGSGFDPGPTGGGLTPDAGAGGSGIDFGTGMGTDAGMGVDLGGTGTGTPLDPNDPGALRP